MKSNQPHEPSQGLDPDVRYREYMDLLEQALEQALPLIPLPQVRLLDAMHYSLSSGGKRIRPALLLEFCRVSGGDYRLALPFACALEMIHTYSLIHDDLPCMDDDGMRRGRPASHKIFGEATALLAGDALLTAAFETMLNPDLADRYPPRVIVEAAHQIAWASGVYGMAGGQLLDLDEEAEHNIETVSRIHLLKTGALIEVAVTVGCLLGGASPERSCEAAAFARCLGLVFQIKDDLLDMTGDPALLGKEVGRDRVKNKPSLALLLGVEECRRMIDELTEQAKEHLAIFEDNSFLLWLADWLAGRET